MDLSRRSFLGALAATPLARAVRPFRPSASAGGSVPGESCAPGLACVLPESLAGFRTALADRPPRHVLVCAGAAGWSAPVADEVRNGAFVIFESGAAFADRRAFEQQRAGLAVAFDLHLERPVALWTDGARPPYFDLQWPVRARVRDFSFVVPVDGAETIGRLGQWPVAALRRAGAGALLFLGSPMGPALGSSDCEAQAWLESVIGAFAGRRTRA